MLILLEKILPADFNTEGCEEKGFEPIRVFSHHLTDYRIKVPKWAYKYVSDSTIHGYNTIKGYCINMFMSFDAIRFGKECEIILNRNSLPYDLLANQPKVKITKGKITYPRKELKDILDAFVEGTHLLCITGI